MFSPHHTHLKIGKLASDWFANNKVHRFHLYSLLSLILGVPQRDPGKGQVSTVRCSQVRGHEVHMGARGPLFIAIKPSTWPWISVRVRGTEVVR